MEAGRSNAPTDHS